MADQKKLRPRQVAAYQSLRAVMVDEAATYGAQIGVNLLLPDGTVGTLAQLSKLFGSTATAGTGTITTTDDVEEGQWNLWFTNLRAQNAVGGILANSANVTLAYVGGTSITADLTSLTDSGAGVLLATTFDAKGRKTGSRAATITGTAGRITVANGDASAGLPTIDLAPVTDAGGGVLQKTAFDAYGRVSGTSAATTTDLAEGSNLYFTAARVLASILTGLSTATSAVISATDTILSALGKLQAQVTANLATLTGHTSNTSNPHNVIAAQVGLGNVDNTSDANKPVSTAQAAADALNLPLDGSRAMTGSINMAGAGVNGQVYFTGTPGGANEGYAYTDSAGGLRFFFIIEATNKVVLCNRAANGVIHLRANNATAGGAGESTVAIVSSAGLLAGSDNTKTLGGSASRWSVVYAATGSINTSDAREKTNIAPLTAAELEAAAELSRAIGTYQWLSMIAEKGTDNARRHAGLTVQRAIAIMQTHGLDPMRYGFICYDQWDELPEVVNSWPAQDAVLDDAGNVITPAVEAGSEITQEYRPAGDRYSFRHDELLLFIARGFAARLDALERT